jgi:putative Mg2+ transporter-C (MgtC) family protein
VVTGIGFLGAGAIIREGISIRGLTTAGSLWVVAAIGVAAGAGYWWPAVAGTALVIFALWPLRALGYLTLERIRQQEDRLVVELREGASVEKLLEEVPRARRVEIDEERDRRVVTLELEHGVAEPALSRLADLEDVIAVRWRR